MSLTPNQLKPDVVAKNRKYNNKNLSVFIKKTAANIRHSSSIDVIKTELDNAIAYPDALSYSNTTQYILGVITLLASWGYWVYLDSFGDYYRFTNVDYVIFAGLIVGFISCIAIVVSHKTKLTKLSSLFRDETLKHLYNMTDCSGQFLQDVQHKFVDFQRGNYSRDVEWGTEIDFNSDTGLIRASVVYHHYVDRRTETYTESDGKGGTRTRTRTVYDHFYRQGVILPPINQVRALVMSSSRLTKKWSQSFMPASREFEKRFYIQADSQFGAAKFLEPTVVIACEQLAKKLTNLTIEFAADGSVLINQHKTNLLEPAMDYDITQPEKFKQELLNDTSLYTVNSIFGFVNQIIKHSVGPNF
jgi:hypothetical protein